jgi:hypothetical protein
MRVSSCILSIVIALSSTFTWAGHKYEPRIPDQTVTPGDLCTRQDPDFDGYRYKEHIAYCERNVTPAQKRQIYDQYNIPKSKRHNYTIDHFIPLSIGGSNSRENLWPEHVKIKELRIDLEINTYYELERGNISQKEAIRIITEAKLNPPLGFDFSDEDPAAVLH